MKKIIMIGMMILFATIMMSCNLSSKKIVYNQEDLGLASIQDYQNLKNLVKDSRDKYQSYLSSFYPSGSRTEDMFQTPEATTDAKSTETYSKTNVQVPGVDEGDIIKTDGNRIYRIRYNSLQVIDILENGNMSVILDETMDAVNFDTNYTYYSDIYLTDQYLVVIGQRYTYYTMRLDDTEIKTDASETDEKVPDWYWFGVAQTVMMIYDIETLELSDTILVSGNLLTTRLIDDSLYVMSTQYVVIDDVTDPRPIFKQGETIIMPSYDEIKFIPDELLDTYTIIVQIKLEDSVELLYDIYLGSSSYGQIYVSKQSILFATYQQSYDAITKTFVLQGKLISYMFNPDGSVVYGGAGNFKGYVINQFALDEYQDTYRMVTTDGWGDSTINRLYVFERQLIDGKRVLVQLALIDEGLGKPRESVRSARFNGHIATIVTAEITDPFYTVDLTDPRNPIIKGELEISGYSTYNHPWGEHYVFNYGYETNESGAITGLKLYLADISDLENPVEVGAPLILLNEQNGWSYSEALYNHKAILIGEELGIVGFAISQYVWTDFEYFYLNHYIIFRIDPNSDTPITIEKTISHIDIYQTYRSDYQTRGYYGYDFGVERAVYVGDYLYVISGAAITSHNMKNQYQLVSQIRF